MKTETKELLDWIVNLINQPVAYAPQIEAIMKIFDKAEKYDELVKTFDKTFKKYEKIKLE